MASNLFAQVLFALVFMTSASTTTRTALAEDFGILVIGGNSESTKRSVEFWSPSDPEEGSCRLSDYPRELWRGPTINFVAGQLVACLDESCERHNDGGWTKLTNTMSRRTFQSSAQREDRILLIGGHDSNSTEWIPTDGGSPIEGPFHVRHGADHCTIQVSSDLIVVTGGQDSLNYVTEYQLTGDATGTAMTPLIYARSGHACGVYQEAGGQEVLLVTGGWEGGWDGGYDRLSSTEVAVYSADTPLFWRKVEGGELPSPRSGLRATVVGEVLYVAGGFDGVYYSDLTTVLSWNPADQTWQEVGDLALGRSNLAVVAVPTSSILCN